MGIRSAAAVLALTLGACASVPATATPRATAPATPKPPTVIGVINGVSADLAKPRIDALRAGLEALGYREGRDFTIEPRFLEGKGQDRAAELTQELVGRGAAFIVTGTPTGVEGARRATTTVPVLMAGAGTDPVADGWVASLARPGGNVTGISLVVPSLPAKRLQVLKDIVPSATRLGVLHDATAGAAGAGVKQSLEAAARSLGIGLETIDAKDMAEVDAALRTFRSSGITAIHINVASAFPANMGEIARLAIAQRIATSFGVPDGVRAGGLLAVGPDQADLYRRIAGYIDKISKGAKPGDLPMERPEKLELIVNLKTAQAIGVTIPDAILAQATDVIR